MKKQTVIILVAAIILLDQALKFYIKLNYSSGEEHCILGPLFNIHNHTSDEATLHKSLCYWFRLHFVENEGMAWGWKFGGDAGKITLTVFRLIAVIWGTFLIRDFIRKQYHKGFIICAALIYAGALGNLIDSMFYGLFFDSTYNFGNHQNFGVVAKLLTGKGYGSFMQGKVVDMLHFPMFEGTFPNWVPFVGEDKRFLFFSPVFNVADASITIGVLTIFIFQNKFFKKPVKAVETTEIKESLAANETAESIDAAIS